MKQSIHRIIAASCLSMAVIGSSYTMEQSSLSETQKGEIMDFIYGKGEKANLGISQWVENNRFIQSIVQLDLGELNNHNDKFLENTNGLTKLSNIIKWANALRTLTFNKGKLFPEYIQHWADYDRKK